jgi:hypothetical protein
VQRTGSNNKKEVENNKRMAKSNDSLTSIATHSSKGIPFMEETAADPVNTRKLLNAPVNFYTQKITQEVCLKGNDSDDASNYFSVEKASRDKRIREYIEGLDRELELKKRSKLWMWIKRIHSKPMMPCKPT